jgi:hypothetical protein
MNMITVGMILTGLNHISRKEICFSAPFSAISPTGTGTGSNLGLRGKRPA